MNRKIGKFFAIIGITVITPLPVLAQDVKKVPVSKETDQLHQSRKAPQGGRSAKSRQMEKKALKSVKSPVPMFEFADQLQEQEAQLAENPMLERFAKERAKYLFDPYCPSYHFVNPEGRMNDPNGLCFWQGRWHLFYQAYPPETDRTHWGHAVSPDLVQWRDLPYAIYPDIEKSSYSGNTLVEQDRVIAMYHGVGAGSMIATSRDPLLLNWEKSAANPVIPMFSGGREEAARRRGPDGSPLPYRIHDPFLWGMGDFYYAITSGTLPMEGKRQYRANFLHRSADLATWEYLHPFDEGDRFTLVGDDGACPYFLPIGDRHMLATFSHQGGSQYLLGDYDRQRDKFIVSSHGRFTFNSSQPCALQSPSASFPSALTASVCRFGPRGKRPSSNPLMPGK